MYANMGQFCTTIADYIEKGDGPSMALAPVVKLYRGMAVMKGFAWGFAFSGGEVVERVAMNVPKSQAVMFGWSSAPLDKKILKFTGPDTVLFSANNQDWDAYYKYQEKMYGEMSRETNASPAMNPFKLIEEQMRAQGLDLHENVLRAIGPGVAYVVDWPKGQQYPDVALVLGLQQEEKFVPVYERLNGMAAGMVTMMGGKTETLTAGEFSGISLSSPKYPWLSPTLFKSKEFFGIGLTGAGVKRMLAANKTALTERELLGEVAPSQPVQGVAYMRLDEITGRAYGLAKPYLTEYLRKTDTEDLRKVADKLPAELATAKLLGTWRAGAWKDGDFRTVEMRSPLGSGVLAAGVGAGAAAVVPVIMKARHAAKAPEPEVEVQATN